MALPVESQRSFRLYVTHVDGEGHFLKICGQLDQQSSLMVESLFKTARDNLENGVGSVSPGAIQDGIICAAKYKDGAYYRAKIISTSNLATGLVGVHFIDYGNKDIISLKSIRLLDSYDPMFLQLRGLATDYYLARIMHPSGRWDEPLLLKLQSLLCYSEYSATFEGQTHTLPLISIQFKGTDFSSHLISIRLGVAVAVANQEALMLHHSSSDSPQLNWQHNVMVESSSYTEHVPFFVNQNFPSNPASAMRLQQSASVPFNGAIVPAPSAISQRLTAHKVSRGPVNLRAPRQPQIAVNPSSALPVTATSSVAPAASNTTSSPKKSTTYKSRLLECNSQHKVLVSFAEEGPELFAVQLVTDAQKLQDMMDDINRRPHKSLTEPPMIGTVCLGRMSGDRIICRAIVMNLSGSQCKLFFVDFGDTEMVSYYDIFDIPEEFVKPNVFAMRFCLSGVKKLEKGQYLNEAFKQLVTGKVMTLRVVAPEGPPLIQYGELYLDNKNVLDLLLSNMKDKLQFKWMDMLQLGSRYSVLVSYVDSCLKFYVQLSDQIDDLNTVMEAVKAHCESTSSPGELPVGMACCARFADDGNWYRACVRSTQDNKIVVAYVDYGNEQEVAVCDIRTITPDLMKLPAQAMKCALKGFENRPVETKTSNQLEMLALEKTLTANVIGVLSNDTMLVSLIDDTVSPPLDVARKMNQLSQPRSTNEIAKPSTPVSKAAQEAPSSPEGPDDRRKYGRETSFNERRRDQPEEFAQRQGSFRNRDNREPFDRAGPGRHSDKFAARPDNRQGERRGGKPWEAAAPADEWEETPSPPKPGPRDNRRKKPDQHDKPGPRAGWKAKDGSGVGKRLKQAAEAASADAQRAKGSIQDRLKRDNKLNKQDEWEEKKSEERFGGTRDTWGERGDRRGERGERREGWAEKKDFPKREFRDRGDRGGRSAMNPRERAERCFGSDRSGGSGNERRAPHKPRGAFTPAPARELAAPVPLDTPYAEPAVEPGAQHEVAVTWIVSPHSFYTQILTLQPKFLEMMHRIPELYKGVRPYSGGVEPGASVLARFPADGVLYRATVVAAQPLSKFVVQYVDFGNKQLVDAKDIWQLERQLTELPKMAVHCSLLGVAPPEGGWRAGPELDQCFNAPRYQCVFAERAEDAHRVSLWSNGASVADALVDKALAVRAEQPQPVALKDEAVDLTAVVGQQIPCRVTHVHSFDKFYVQLDLEKAALVEEAVASFDAALLTPLAADSLADGVHCTVHHEGRVFRAILGDTADAARVTAVLPDYGRAITTSLDQLMILPTELSVYYYQSLECCLNNYSAESRRLLTEDVLKTRLEDNKFIVYIDSVEGISLVTTLYDIASGQKLALFEPDEGAFDEVSPLCLRTVLSYNFGLASVQHLENLNEIHLQRVADLGRVQALLDSLFAFYEEGAPEPLTDFAADTPCAAKSSDENWYRAMIVSASDDAATVQFPDYGNKETVPKSLLKKLDPRFHEPCALALEVGLGLEALQDAALARLTEWTADREVQVTLACGADGWLASLHLNGQDLSLRLVDEQLAAPRSAAAEPAECAAPAAPAEPEGAAAPPPPPPGCVQAYISHIDSPGHFWLQLAERVARIDEVQAALQAGAAAYPALARRELGTLCAAKYSADELWYRAQVLDLDADITTVRFVDYGNTDVLDNQPGVVKELPEALAALEPLALRSSVNAVPTGTGQWSEAATDSFTEFVGDTEAPVDALIVLKDETTYVDLFVGGQNVTDRLVALGHAARAEQPECGDLPACFASHVNSPSEFWIQLESATAELQAMEAAMVDAEHFPALPSREEGVLCAAKYPEDEAWYRAQVIVDGSEGTEVLFMDYGNASIASELRSLPPELKVKPALSRKCALQKPRDVKAWTRHSESKFNELAAEGATIFKVQFIAAGDISIVELYLEGRSVTEQLVGLCEQRPPAERPAPDGAARSGTGRLCYVGAHDELYVHLDSQAADFETVTEIMGDAEGFVQAAELKVGALCAAFSAEDEQWHRARVIEFCDQGCLVRFIDYGNKAKCDAVRALPEHAAAIEPLAKCCRLAGIDASSAAAAARKLNQYMADDATFHIEFLDTISEPTLVRLVLDGEDITTTFSASKPSEPENVNVSKEEVNAATAELTGQNKNAEIEETNNTQTLNEEQDCTNKKDSNEQLLESKLELADDNQESGISVKTLSTLVRLVLDGEDITTTFSASKPSEPENVNVSKEEVNAATAELTGQNKNAEIEETNNTQTLNEEQDCTNKKDSNEQLLESKLELADDNQESGISVKTLSTLVRLVLDGEDITTTFSASKPSEPENVNVSKEEVNAATAELTGQNKNAEIEETNNTQTLNEEQDCTNKKESNEQLLESKLELADDNQESGISVKTNEEDDEFDDANELNSSKLDESLESTNTVIENQSFEANPEMLDDIDDKGSEFESPKRDTSSETLENSNDTIKTPERDDSKDSINTDTGYTSSGPSKDNSPLRESTDATDPSTQESTIALTTQNKSQSDKLETEGKTVMEPDLINKDKIDVES